MAATLQFPGQADNLSQLRFVYQLRPPLPDRLAHFKVVGLGFISQATYQYGHGTHFAMALDDGLYLHAARSSRRGCSEGSPRPRLAHLAAHSSDEQLPSTHQVFLKSFSRSGG